MTFDSRWRLFADPAAVPSAPAGLDVHEQQAMIQAAFKPVPRFGYDYLFLAGYGLINVVGCALATAAYVHGWGGMIAAANLTDQCLAIAAVFLVGLLVSTLQAVSLSRDLAAVYTRLPPSDSRAGEYLALIRGRSGESRFILAGALRSKLMMRASFVRYLARTLLALGLIGTAAALILAPANPAIAPTEAYGAGAAFVNLMGVTSGALYMALLGGVLHVWLMANHRVLKSGAAHLVNLIVERGELEFAE